MKKNLIFALGLSLITGFTACSSEIEDGTTDIDSWEMPPMSRKSIKFFDLR